MTSFPPPGRPPAAVLRCLVMLPLVTVFSLPVGASSPRPNVVLLVADDLGYSDLGCFGSEIATPNLDRLAAEGVVLTNFHTAATCSPTRAMLLTGVDHHLAGMGSMVEFQTPQQLGQPGYEGHLNDRVVSLAQLLADAGYYTAIAGKWHLGSDEEHVPKAKGFERSWALLQGHADHYHPGPDRRFNADGRSVQYPAGRYSAEWYTDKAIEYVREAQHQDKPFLLYVAYTSPHWPLQAPAERIEKYRGQYARGYEWLRQQRTRGLKQKQIIAEEVRVAPQPSMRPYLHPTVPVRPFHLQWDQLPSRIQELEARKMEVYAAMVDEMDAQIGRLLAVLKEFGEYDNTLILFMSDNGAAPSEVSGYGYGPDWAQACTGPFRLMKGYPTEGGTRCPCIVKLPGANKARASSEFASVLDIAPTLYELAEMEYPAAHDGNEIVPLQGESMLPHLQSQRDTVHDSDYAMGWELFGRAAFRQGEWKIVSIERPFGKGTFELFHLGRDPGETEDLRETHTEVFRDLKDHWESYAKRANVVSSRPSDSAGASQGFRQEAGTPRRDR